jgi:hypothetical protein
VHRTGRRLVRIENPNPNQTLVLLVTHKQSQQHSGIVFSSSTQHNSLKIESMSSASEILQELESLKNEKTKIEHKISLLEAQLKDINLQKQVSASSNGSSPYPTNGLEPHMIHRYSRHLVLPSFGVQGTYS